MGWDGMGSALFPFVLLLSFSKPLPLIAIRIRGWIVTCSTLSFFPSLCVWRDGMEKVERRI